VLENLLQLSPELTETFFKVKDVVTSLTSYDAYLALGVGSALYTGYKRFDGKFGKLSRLAPLAFSFAPELWDSASQFDGGVLLEHLFPGMFVDTYYTMAGLVVGSAIGGYVDGMPRRQSQALLTELQHGRTLSNYLPLDPPEPEQELPELEPVPSPRRSYAGVGRMALGAGLFGVAVAGGLIGYSYLPSLDHCTETVHQALDSVEQFVSSITLKESFLFGGAATGVAYTVSRPFKALGSFGAFVGSTVLASLTDFYYYANDGFDAGYHEPEFFADMFANGKIVGGTMLAGALLQHIYSRRRKSSLDNFIPSS
jgi:hypothetical protein